jgi:hypothetical protein
VVLPALVPAPSPESPELKPAAGFGVGLAAWSRERMSQWKPEGEGFAIILGGVVYRARRFAMGHAKAGRYGAWAGGRLLGDAAKLAGARAICEREAVRAAAGKRPTPRPK